MLSQGVTRGLKDDDIPAAMRLYLMDNTFRFSGFKTHRQLQAASRLLMDNGRIRPFSDFLQKVRKIDKDYNATYLNAEYNFAVASAQAAARWHDFSASSDDYFLQYRTARDERVRASHRPLDRITLPADDPFWDEFFPPNGWNCRCNVVQVGKNSRRPSNSAKAIACGRAATTQLDSKGRNKAKIFRFNPGKKQKVFPDKHPYFKVNDFEQILKDIQSLNWKEKITFGKQYLKENKVGKVAFAHPLFEGRKAHFYENTIHEVIRYAKTFDIKFEILSNIEDYLDSNAELTVEIPKDNKDKARRFFVLTTIYNGINENFKGKTIQILFRENQNKTINIHFIRLPKDK